MAGLFTQILNMSLTGSVVICAVLLARACMRRLPKIFSYALWSVVLFRLLCPVAFTAPVSVLEIVDPQMQKAAGSVTTVSYIPVTTEQTVDFISVPAESTPIQDGVAEKAPEQLQMTPMHTVALVWISGAGILMLYSVVQYLLIRRKLIGCMQLQRNVYLADHIETAFVMGIVRPKIYIPSNLTEHERSYILAHERHHIRRLDHITKLLGFLALCIHWFNPLVWISFALAGKDMEMSCDEAVIKKLGGEIRADYSASLLRLATHKKVLPGMPLAFGEGDTRSRVLNMVKWKKPARWVAAVCVILCLIIVAVCAFNPEEQKTIEELTRHTSDGPVGTGIGDLFYTYPAGLTSEQREVENWTAEEQLRSIRGLPNRGQYDHFFIDNGVDFGGVVDFLVPENREINLEALNLPSEWVGLDYIAGSSLYPYAELEYTLIKDGKDYINLYLYTYSGRGYFLWFYADQGNPAHKQAILESVEMGNGGIYVTKLKRNEEVSLGQFNMTILEGYGYYRNETVILEITRKEAFGGQKVVGCVTARPNPDLTLGTDTDWVQWVEAVGLDLHQDDPGYGYTITDEGEFGDISLTMEAVTDGKRILSERHYFYIAGDIVYHLWFNAMEMNRADDKQMLQSIWIKESYHVPSGNKWVTTAGVSPVQIGVLPDGYNYGFDGDRNIIFAWGKDAIGGIIEYPIPEDVYDPFDIHFMWLEKMGIPDFEDGSLIYTGGMTSGDNGWVAEFASDVPSGTPATVHRRHTFRVVGDRLYDIWFDMLKISRDNMQEILSAVHLPQAAAAAEAEESDPEEIAFEKTQAIMEAVSDGSSHIVSLQRNAGYEGPGGYEKTFLYHEGNYLYTNRVLTAGENITDAGAYYNRYALLIVEDECFSNEGHQGESGEIIWSVAEPEDPEVPWLGSRIWNKSFATYIDTLADDSGTCYMFRYDKPYKDSADFDRHYFVNFYFDAEGKFLNVQLQVNLFRENEITVTESIVSLDPDSVFAEIQKEYLRAAA